ncbi:MAG TPA: response regulator [Blastocatellia bacterium]|nr:response regulator [Blastocatellia bacterium]
MRHYILCVDDHEDSLEFLSIWLEQRGYLVCSAGAATEALHLATTRSFDLYILDTGLTDPESGEELYGRIRECDPRIPILIFSGDPRETTKARALSKGAQAYLTKPCDPEVIANVVKELLEARVGGG